MSPNLWTLKNPHTLPMIITLNPNGSVSASFPALECSATVWDDDPWKARDEAILCYAKVMVRKMEEEGRDGHEQLSLERGA